MLTLAAAVALKLAEVLTLAAVVPKHPALEKIDLRKNKISADALKTVAQKLDAAVGEADGAVVVHSAAELVEGRVLGRVRHLLEAVAPPAPREAVRRTEAARMGASAAARGNFTVRGRAGGPRCAPARGGVPGRRDSRTLARDDRWERARASK